MSKQWTCQVILFYGLCKIFRWSRLTFVVRALRPAKTDLSQMSAEFKTNLGQTEVKTGLGHNSTMARLILVKRVLSSGPNLFKWVLRSWLTLVKWVLVLSSRPTLVKLRSRLALVTRALGQDWSWSNRYWGQDSPWSSRRTEAKSDLGYRGNDVTMTKSLFVTSLQAKEAFSKSLICNKIVYVFCWVSSQFFLKLPNLVCENISPFLTPWRSLWLFSPTVAWNTLIFGPGRRVPKRYSSCCCCCYQFSKNP